MRVLLKRPWFTALGMFRPNENPDDGTSIIGVYRIARS